VQKNKWSLDCLFYLAASGGGNIFDITLDGGGMIGTESEVNLSLIRDELVLTIVGGREAKQTSLSLSEFNVDAFLQTAFSIEFLDEGFRVRYGVCEGTKEEIEEYAEIVFSANVNGNGKIHFGTDRIGIIPQDSNKVPGIASYKAPLPVAIISDLAFYQKDVVIKESIVPAIYNGGN